MPDSIVEVKQLTKSYGNKKVVKKVSFSVKKGEVFGILGPNGAGKTTTLEMIESIREIDEGHVEVDGIDVEKNPWDVKNIIGVQQQTPAFMDKVKLKEHIEQIASIYGEKVDAQALLKEVNLAEEENSYFETLSGGQKQRFSIAASLVHNPKVFFMDEPTTGLDPQARHNLWDLIRKTQSRGVTIILTTHYMEEAEQLCQRVAIMDRGEIIALDTPKNLIKKLLKSGFKKARHVEQANLEDVFIDLTGKELRD